MRFLIVLAIFGSSLEPTLAFAQRSNSKQLLKSVQGLLREYGKAASVSRTSASVSKFESTLDDVGECRAKLRSRWEFGAGVRTNNEYELRLSELSPVVQVRRWDSDPIFSVRVVSSSGGNSIPKRGTDGQHFAEIIMGDSAMADSAARTLGQSIEVCGGQPQTPQAEAQAAAADSVATKAVAAIFASDLSPEERADLVQICHVRVGSELRKSRLAVPETASYPDSASIIKTDSTLSIIGRVLAEDGYGRRVAGPYICSFEQYGTQFIPTKTTAAPTPQ